uniref:Putative sap30-binding protein n=1 Tax=Ixodes ricinus TaxID=34613 RepID=V5IIL4_IXORI
MNSEPSRPTALASLTETYTDSEGELDSDSDSNELPAPAPRPIEPKPPSIDSTPSSQNGVPLVSYRAEEDDDDFGEDVIVADEDSISDLLSDVGRPAEPRTPVRPESPVSFHRCLLDHGPNRLFLPPEPPGRCSQALQDKISRLYERKLRDGKDMNASIQTRKDFRNPSIYEKLIAYCGIDEMGTNYPPEVYDPHCWGPSSYYEELSKRQKEEMDRREKEKKTKVEFLTGTAKKPGAEAAEGAAGLKRKSKWDVGSVQTGGVMMPAQLKPATLVTPQVVPVSLPTGTKPTVISAFGTLPKKTKQ